MTELKLNNIDAEIDKIKNDYINGSSVIVRKALSLIEKLLKFNDPQLIIETAEKLKTAKHSIISLYNLMNFFIEQIKINSENLSDKFENFVKLVDLATETSIQSAFEELFKDLKSASIVTCSYSSNVCKTIRKAHQEGIKIKLYALHSYWRGNSFHQMVIEQARSYGIDCTYLPLESLENSLKQIDMGIIGADIIFHSGAIINGIPSFYMASKMENKVPLYSVAESYKIATAIKIEDGFDYLPQNLVTKVFSDTIFKSFLEFKI